MQNYVDFSICTEHALTYVSEHHKLVLSETQKGTLLSAYRVLPTFDDVGDALDDLKSFKPNPQLFTAIYCAAQG